MCSVDSLHIILLVAVLSDISAGTTHTCAVVGSRVRCWGTGYAGQLGYGADVVQLNGTDVAAAVSDAPFVTVFAHMCRV